MKKKIVFFMPSFEGGGVEKNLIMIANYFASKFDKLLLITATKKYKKKFDQRIAFKTPKYSFWFKFGRFPKYVACLILLVLEYFKNKNIVVFCFQGNLYCIILCKILNIEIVIRPNSSPSGWIDNSFKKILFSNILKLANKIIVNSHEFKKEFWRELNIKTEYIFNPLNSIQIKKLSRQKINNSFFSKNSLKIITVGRLVDQKDHFTLLKAVNIIKKNINFRLIIIGEGEKKSSLQRFINENKLKKFIKIMHYTNNPFPYIKQADIFVLSSLFEGLPNVLLEAILLKNFIISSNCKTGPKEILDYGKGGLLFKIGNYRDLANKILFYKNNRSMCNNKKKIAINRLNRFNYKKNLKKYSDVFYKFL